MERKNICIVVLGDIGRSPRMQYHAISLAEEGHVVDIVGYKGADPVDALTNQPLVSYHYLNPYPNIPLPKLLNYIFKTLWQIITLSFVLLILRKPHYILVQNPPAVPTLFVCYLHSIIYRAKLIIDWHNYAFSIMALSTSPKSFLVKITKKLEEIIGKRADYNFCVTKAMKDDLSKQWGIEATVLYDRPPTMFHPIDIKEKHDVICRLGKSYEELLLEDGTIFTTMDGENKPKLRDQRPGLLISSTSWTEDEDFSVLLAALSEYENECNTESRKLPKLICIITGKGPLKEYYTNKINELNFQHLKVITPWLEASDYPLLLASADLGVSLHTSSSGLDLPMKVVDMFGCGLPVCAYNFKCLNELVRHEENSFVFNDIKELSQQILNWFENFPNNRLQQQKINKFSEELKVFQNMRWKENWSNVASGIFKQ